MHILGLDVSSNSTGWAILDDDKVLHYGVIKTSGTCGQKLLDYYSQLLNILEEYNYPIEWVGIEDTYIANAKVTKLLSQYAGVTILAIAIKYGIFEILRHTELQELVIRMKNPRAKLKIPKKGIYMPTPTEVFKLLNMYLPQERSAKKTEARDWVRNNLYIDIPEDQDDQSDAICIAFATKEAIKLIQGAGV